MNSLDRVSKRYYLATRRDRADDAKRLIEYLTELGWERTFAWDDSSGRDAAATAVAELGGVRSSDVLIVLLPGGYGTHVEIGAALALQIPIVIHSPDRNTLETPYPCVFHYHPGVTLLIDEVLNVGDLVHAIEQAVRRP